MKIHCNAAVSLLRKNNNGDFEAIKGYEIDPYFIARYLVHQDTSNEKVNGIFKYGNFSFAFGMHDYFGKPKPNNITPENELTIIPDSKLDDYVGYGGFTKDNDESMDKLSDNFFYWDRHQWQYLVEDESGRFQKFVPLKKVLDKMNKNIMR